MTPFFHEPSASLPAQDESLADSYAMLKVRHSAATLAFQSSDDACTKPGAISAQSPPPEYEEIAPAQDDYMLKQRYNAAVLASPRDTETEREGKEISHLTA